MNVNILFDTGNAAFDNDFEKEVSHVAQNIAKILLDSENRTAICQSIKDSNGNRIGFVNISAVKFFSNP